MVGDVHPHLHARPEGRAPLLDPLHGDDRRHRDGRQRPHAGRAAHVRLHHADGEAAGDQLVPTRRSLRRAGRARPALQPAGPGGRSAAAADAGLQDPRLDAARDVGRGPGPAAGDRTGRPRRLRSQGRRRHRGRELDGPRRGVLDRDVGPGPAGQAGTDPGRAADHDGAADRELDRAHRPHRDARRPGQRADAAAADLHHGARADVLRRRAAVPDPSAIPIAGTRCACAARC